MLDPRLVDLLNALGLVVPPDNEVSIEGSDPVLGCKFPAAEGAAVELAAIGVAVSDLWEQRTGRRQRARVEVRKAGAALRAAAHQRLNGEELVRPYHRGLEVSAPYRCRDGRWIHMQGGFPHLGEGTLELLGCGPDPDDIAAAVAGWDSQPLEDALAEARMCGAIIRTREEWVTHPQGSQLAPLPPVEVIKIGESEPEALPGGDRPLSGVRVLDLTRVLAGPTCGRTLAEHGADVLLISSPNLPFTPPNVYATGLGKLSAWLDLEDPDQHARLRELAAETDIFTQGYRAGSLDRRGFSPEALAELRPGVIYVSINCYGHVGPWRERPGWEQLGQSVSGLAAGQGEPDRPEVMPAQFCDYGTGFMAALGTLVALGRRAREGGSYHVRASLSQTGMWLSRQKPRFDPAEAAGIGDLDDLCQEVDTIGGRHRFLAPALELSETAPYWARPAVPLGTHPAAWPV